MHLHSYRHQSVSGLTRSALAFLREGLPVPGLIEAQLEAAGIDLDALREREAASEKQMRFAFEPLTGSLANPGKTV